MPKSLSQSRATLADFDEKHGEYMDSIIATFEKRLDLILEKARNAVVDDIASKLKVADDGTLIGGVANRNILARIDVLFRKEMKAAGYDNLVAAFVNQFPEQLPLLDDTLKELSSALGEAFSRKTLLTPADYEKLANQQRLTLEGLRNTVSEVAGLAKERSMASYNGLRPAQLERLITKTFDTTSGRARTLANTGMAVWYRQATAFALDAVEKKTPLEYTYDGPRDKLNRPFCADLKAAMAKGKTWTKPEIDAMDNGQLPDVFRSGGGFNCRHQWRVALTEDHADNFERSSRVASGGLLQPDEVTSFTKNSVVKGTYVHRTANAAAAARLRGAGIDYTFAPPNAPFGAGFYAGPGSKSTPGAQVAFNIRKPLAGTFEEVKEKVADIAGGIAADLSPKARAQAIRAALLRKGYDGIVAIRPNGQRMIVALKQGSAALIAPQ